MDAAPSPAPIDLPLPPYADRARFTEVEVRVGPEPDALGGTVSMPVGEGPFPGLVLVHGSGPNDRDETVGASRPFRDLAAGLASRGVAVLRYDKRTKACPGSLARFGLALTVKEETIDDAASAIRLLAATPGIDPARVHVLGHSLGGYLGPRIAAAAPEIAGLVVLAGSARPMEDLIVEQVTYILSLHALPEETVNLQMAILREQVARVKSPDLSPDAPPASLPLSVPAPYWLDLRGYSPADDARRLDLPILVLQGGRDYQVIEADFALWRAALSDRPRAELAWLPDLNHLFIPGTGKSRPEEYAVPGHVAEEVVSRIADFVTRRQAA